MGLVRFLSGDNATYADYAGIGLLSVSWLVLGMPRERVAGLAAGARRRLLHGPGLGAGRRVPVRRR